MDPGLYEAIRLGNVDFLKARTTDDALLRQKTPKDNNILHIAAEFKQVKFFAEIAERDDQSLLFWAANKHGDTPLHVAARVGCEEVTIFLINHSKKKKNTLPNEEEAPLTVAVPAAAAADAEAPLPVAVAPPPPDVVLPPHDAEAYKELLRVTNLRKDTAIHVAVQYGQNEAVNLLMEADPELCCLTNSANESPLFVAVRKGFYPIARSILENRPAQPFISFEGTDGVTALHAAVTNNSRIMRRLVSIMVEKSGAVRKADAIGWIPLHYAALKGDLRATRILLTNDSSTAYILDKTGMSALHVAACLGHTKVLKELIQRRPDACDLLNEKGQNILHSAVLGEQRFVINYILKTPELGRLINEGDREGNTPLHLAAVYKKSIVGKGDVIKRFTTHPRVDKTSINNEFSHALDIYKTDKNTQNTRVDPSWLKLGRCAIGVPFLHKQILREIGGLESTQSRADDPSSSTKNSVYNGTENFQSEADSRIFSTNLLVATLIATVTFSAAFTMPGGYTSDGTPALNGKAFFILFLICDAYSFFMSVFAMFLHFYETNTGDEQPVNSILPSITFQALLGMMAAFCAGISAVLVKSSLYLAISISIAGGYICTNVFGMFVGPRNRRRKMRWFSRRIL